MSRSPSAGFAPAPSRRLGLGVVLICGAAFAALAAWRVPWQWLPGGHVVPVPARTVFTPAEIARGIAYSAPVEHLSWAAYAASVVVALVLGLTPIGSWLVRRLPGPWWVRVPVGVLVLLLIGTIVTWPFAWKIRTYDLRFGLTNQAAAGWWQDQSVAFVVSWVTTSIGLLVLVLLGRRSPRRWPAWGALVAMVLTFAGAYAYPGVVEPLFNTFTPLAAGPLRSDILRLAAREHVGVSDVLVENASVRTTALNAYVSGFAGSRRVVLYDNLVRELPRRQVDVVVAHELGHAARNDVLLGTALGALGIGAGVGLLGLVLGASPVRRWSRVRALADPEVVALVLALAAVGTFLASPLENTISRAIEARADRASLAATHDVPAFIAVQRRLAVSYDQQPTPPALAEFWWGTHPTTLQRIGLAEAVERTWRTP